MRSLTLRSLILAAVYVLAFLPGNASADFIIGPGTAGTSTDLDTGNGTRLNISLLSTLFTTGTYQPLTFNYDTGNFQAGANGQVIPFLATYDISTTSYTVIAVGDVITTLRNQNDASAAFGGTTDFTITGNTQVYAGFQSLGTQNPITFINGTTNTDHDNPGYTQAQLLVGFSFFNLLPAFTNPNLDRTYLFSVTAVPEPSSVSLLLLGIGAGIVAIRRRKQNRAAATKAN